MRCCADVDQPLIALEAAQALAKRPSSQLAVVAAASPLSCTPCPHRLRHALNVTSQSPRPPCSIEEADQGTLALLRTAATELQGQRLVVSFADCSHAASLRSPDLPCAKPAEAATAIAANAEQHGMELVPRLLRSPALVAEADMLQIRSLQPGSLSSLAAVPFSRCARFTMLGYRQVKLLSMVQCSHDFLLRYVWACNFLELSAEACSALTVASFCRDGALQPHEVLLSVTSTGLNFRDVLNVLGMYPGDPGPPGEYNLVSTVQ